MFEDQYGNAPFPTPMLKSVPATNRLRWPALFTPTLRQRQMLEILALLAGWRVIMLLVALVAAQFGEHPPETFGDLILRTLDQWDAGWYMAIARDGYSAQFDGGTGQGNIAFYPLLPMLIRLAHIVVPSWRLAGALVVHLALAGALLYLCALVSLDYDWPTARRAVIALLIFPTAIFLTAIYTESLLLLALTAALYHARRGQWWAAGLWGAAAGLTKTMGAIVLVALLWEYWRARAWRGVGWKRLTGHLASLALIPLGAVAFLGYLHLRFGNYKIYFIVQTNWYRGSWFRPFFPDGMKFLEAFFNGTSEQCINSTRALCENYFYPQGAVTLPTTTTFMVIDLLFLLLGLLIGVAILWRVRVSYGLLTILGLLVIAYSGSPQSFNRYTLVLFPIPIAWALAARRPLIAFALFLTSALLLTWHVYLFINGYWAG
jgi:Mannosyltransferase (PIG-V)